MAAISPTVKYVGGYNATQTDRVVARRTVQSSAHVQAMAIALALFLPCAIAAQTPAQSPDDTAICETVARTVLAIDPPKDWRGPWQSPIRALGKASGGTVSVDAQTWRSDKTQALDKLRREYRADPGLLKAIGDLTDGRWIFSVQRFGGSSLNMAKVVEGSASCERFVFFDAPAGGASHPIAAPSVVRDAEPFAFCYRTTAHAGEVAGVPAFVVESDHDSTVELSLTPWRNGAWQPECRLLIRFTDVFEVTERYCKDVDCQELANQALSFATKVDQRPEASQEDAKSQSEKFKPLKDLAEADPGFLQRFPTFGVNGPRYEFASDSLVLPLAVGNETYLVRVGHAAIAWRTYPDYLFGAYKLVGHRLEPVAGFYITKTRGKPVGTTVN